MNEVVKMPSGSVNILGLRKGQAELFKYICKCSDEKRAVEMYDVAIIFYTYTRTSVRVWNGFDSGRRNENGLEYFKSRFEARGASYPYLYTDTKNWLKMCLGSFVMRGLLVAIPTFKPEETQDV